MDYVKKIISYSNPQNVKLISKTNLTAVFLITATLMLITSPFAINDAFANHLSDELKWQLVYLSSQPACANYHYQMTSVYHDISLKYMDLYQVEQSSYDPLCIPEKKYYSNYVSPDDLDLIILIYDKDLGQKELHENKMGGLYTHSGLDRTQNHAVIICDCPNFYYSDAAWILSHELSHFVLYYKDYQMSVIEDVIHETDAKYDQCLEEYTDECKSIKTKLVAGPGLYAYSVMPVYEPAIGIKSVNENKPKNNIHPIVSELSKIITKWWAEDKISEGDYANAIGYVVDNEVLSSHDDFKIIMADDPIDETVTWKEVIDELKPPYWDHAPPMNEQEKTDELLSKIPYNLLSDDLSRYSEDNKLGLPDWFKNTAKWWANDEITNKDFNKNVEYLLKSGIIRSHTSEIFQELASEVETLPNSKTKQNSAKVQADEIKVQADEIKVQADEIKVPNDAKSVTEMMDYMQSLVDSKAIKEIYGNRLLKELNSANSSFEIGKTNNACNKLEKFSAQVDYLTGLNQIGETLASNIVNSLENLNKELC